MAISQRRVLVQHDIDFDVEVVAGMVGLQALDLLDGLCETHGEVEKDVAFVGRGGGTGKITDVLGRGLRPVVDDVEGEEDTAQRI